MSFTYNFTEEYILVLRDQMTLTLACVTSLALLTGRSCNLPSEATGEQVKRFQGMLYRRNPPPTKWSSPQAN